MSAINGRRLARALNGLYHGKRVIYGNNVSFSNKKTRRRWEPNVQNKQLYSDLLDLNIPVKVTSAALRSIDKVGGIDNYILSTKDINIEGFGMMLRDQVQDAYRLKYGKEPITRSEFLRKQRELRALNKQAKRDSFGITRYPNAEEKKQDNIDALD